MKPRALALARLPVLMGLAVVTACARASTSAPVISDRGNACAAGEVACNVVSGYSGNSVVADATGATIGGGGLRGAPNQVSAQFGTIGGGQGNVAGEDSTVGGGSANTAVHFRATVGGGTANLADGEEATVGGGLKNTASQRFATVAGGSLNVASDIDSTVGGGSGNIANYQFTTIGGGTQNLASNVASVVAGGEHNLAQGAYSAVAGGLNNSADGYLTSILGGAGNTATGSYAAITGGFANTAAGNFSVAMGSRANISADHPGTFLFADSSNFAFASAAANEFAVRATGGVRIVTGIDQSGNSLAGVRLSPGSGSWESLSDANSKSGFAPVDGRSVLASLALVPISTWYYRGQGPSVQHIGPMAQDFYTAFKFGEDDHYIGAVDEEGVALASIQELYRMVQRQDAASQQQKIDALEQRLALSNALTVLALVIAVGAFRKKSQAEGRA